MTEGSNWGWLRLETGHFLHTFEATPAHPGQWIWLITDDHRVVLMTSDRYYDTYHHAKQCGLRAYVRYQARFLPSEAGRA